MATVIKKIGDGWDVNGVIVNKDNYKELLEDDRDIKNFEYHLQKTAMRKIYKSTYPCKN